MNRIVGVRIFLAYTLCLMMLLPVLADTQVAWVKTFDQALGQASREKKHIVLDMSASW